MDHSKGPKRIDASHGKHFIKRTRFFLGMRFSPWYSQNIVVSSKIFSWKFLPTVFHQNLIKVKKGPFLARFHDYWMIQIFPGKKGSVSFLPLLSSNLLPSFVEILRAVLCNFWTDTRTDTLFFGAMAPLKWRTVTSLRTCSTSVVLDLINWLWLLWYLGLLRLLDCMT